MKKKMQAPKPRNPVAKYLRQFNKATVERDGKRLQKNKKYNTPISGS